MTARLGEDETACESTPLRKVNIGLRMLSDNIPLGRDSSETRCVIAVALPFWLRSVAFKLASFTVGHVASSTLDEFTVESSGTPGAWVSIPAESRPSSSSGGPGTRQSS